MDGADTQAIIDQVRKCPSGALSFYYNRDGDPEPANENATPATTPKIEVSPNGPYLVTGCVIVHSNGEEETKQEVVALCRCGASASKPFCDGSHSRTGFEG